ncbi:MAG: histidine phosphatase family protein [Chloroflexota bacterium]|nr:histidine phosphatase family protein [Chloroflexota bacterium]
MNVYLVRHCQAAGQEPDAPLTPAGEARARDLAEFLGERGIRRIVSSPFARGRASVAPLAERLGLAVEIDDRLAERVLCGAPLVDWRERLRASFDDVDLCLDGGESSRVAMARGAAALRDALDGARPVVVVTHGNLLALLLRHLDDRSGFTAWERLTNPDVFSITVLADALRVERIWREG